MVLCSINISVDVNWFKSLSPLLEDIGLETFYVSMRKKNSIHGQCSSIHTIFTGSYNKLGSVNSSKYLYLVIWNVLTNKMMFSYQALKNSFYYVLSLFSHYIDLYVKIFFERQLHVKSISSTLIVDAPIFKKLLLRFLLFRTKGTILYSARFHVQ